MPNVMVAVRGARAFGVSDAAGAFLLAGLTPGRQTVRVLYGDNLSYEHEITLQRGKTLTLVVLLDVEALTLSPIVVEATGLGAQRTLAAFYERRKRGIGRYYSPADLDEQRMTNPLLPSGPAFGSGLSPIRTLPGSAGSSQPSFRCTLGPADRQ